MFKKRFDREIGEERKCKKCDVMFHTHKPIWQCPKCACSYVNRYVRERYEYKECYPFNNKELYGNHGASRRFTQIRQKLNKCKTREELTAHYDRQLKEIEENGILAWIKDDRTRKPRKNLNKINHKDYPSTKNVNHDDYV